MATVTPLPLSKRNDLAPGLPDADKLTVYVMRCNGEFEAFLLDPRSLGDSQNSTLTGTLQLQPGDVILSLIHPASMMGRQPAELPGTAMPEVPLSTLQFTAPPETIASPPPSAGTEKPYP